MCDGDADRSLVAGAGIGRDADTIASVLGGLAGALTGASAIRADLVAECESANASFFAEVEGDQTAGFAVMAERLVGALEAERQSLRRRLERLDGWL